MSLPDDPDVLFEVARHLKSREPLPLHLAVTLSNGGLERLWADNDDPLSMVDIIRKTHRPLHPIMAVRALRSALSDLPDARITLDQLEQIAALPPEALWPWGSPGAQLIHGLEKALETTWHAGSRPRRTESIEYAQAALRSLLRELVLWKRQRQQPAMYPNYVRDAVADAQELHAPPHELTQVIRDFYPMPPTLVEILATIESPASE